jgi:hypothetical protein
MAENFHIKLVAYDRFLYNLHVFGAFLLCQHAPTEGNILTEFVKRMTQAAIDAFMFSIEELKLRFPFDALEDFGNFNNMFSGLQRIFWHLLNDEVVPALLLVRLIDEVTWRKEHITAFLRDKRYGPELEFR